MPDTDNLLYVNGINGSSGTYGLAPLTEAELAQAIRGETIPNNLDELEQRNQESPLIREILRDRLAQLQAKRRSATRPEADTLDEQIAALEKELSLRDIRGTVQGVDDNDLRQTGWGIIFAEDAPPVIKEALAELLDHRRKQAGELFRLFDGPDGYRPNDDHLEFLARHGVGPGPVDPGRGVPYYLLIVGSPEVIPYQFQYQLDVQFAVGRIDFGDDVAAYAQYARNLVSVETGGVKLSRRLTFFGVANPDDRASQMGTDHLVIPLSQRYQTRESDWTVDLIAEEAATKAHLSEVLNGDQSPALLFTAGHGMEFNPDDSRQRLHQGALLCQDWDGPVEHLGPVTPDLYFAGDDLTSQANLLGLMTFHFACYGAGTPQFDDFARLRNQRKVIAERPFIAHLPQQLLQRGALATVGHVERAWGYSFFWPDAGEQLAVFESTLDRLMHGHPIGSALEYFNERYAELATILTAELDQVEAGRSPHKLPGLWTANNDARNYVIIGDPAARLPVAQPNQTPDTRPAFEVVNFTATPKPIPNKPFSTITDADWVATPQAVKDLLWQLSESAGKEDRG